MRTPHRTLWSLRSRRQIHAALLAATLALLAAAIPAHAQPAAAAGTPPQGAAAPRDGQHDFDFEFGTWKAHLRRLLHPLTGSNDWVELDAISTVRKVWDGRANLGEFRAGSATTTIEGLSLRLYNPETRQWSIYWANAKDGDLGRPMIGGFANGRGEFYDQESFQGRAIFVRFVFSDITATTFRLEQAFSADGGKTWEPNWVVAFTREKEGEKE